MKFEVSATQFLQYEEVRESGVTNMFDANKVSELTGLNRTQILYIMENYGALAEAYLVDNEEEFDDEDDSPEEE